MLMTVVGVKRSFPSVCASVCSHDNSKMNEPNVFKLGIVNDLGVSTSGMILGLKGQMSRSQSAETY